MTYPSRYSHGKEVTPAQYITEIICERKAAQLGKDLPQKFWVLPEWNKFYRSQIGSANQLLKYYSPAAILAALRTYEMSWVYSLRAPQLIDVINREQRRVDALEAAKTAAQAKNQEQTGIAPVEGIKETRGPYTKNTTLSKLKNLDDV